MRLRCHFKAHGSIVASSAASACSADNLKFHVLCIISEMQCWRQLSEERVLFSYLMCIHIVAIRGTNLVLIASLFCPLYRRQHRHLARLWLADPKCLHLHLLALQGLLGAKCQEICGLLHAIALTKHVTFLNHLCYQTSQDRDLETFSCYLLLLGS